MRSLATRREGPVLVLIVREGPGGEGKPTNLKKYPYLYWSFFFPILISSNMSCLTSLSSLSSFLSEFYPNEVLRLLYCREVDKVGRCNENGMNEMFEPVALINPIKEAWK